VWGDDRSASDCAVAFGPDRGHYVAWSAADYTSLLPLDGTGDDADTALFSIGKLKLATFGVDWAYFYLQPDGRWKYDDPGNCYKTLSEIMDDLDDGDIEVS